MSDRYVKGIVCTLFLFFLVFSATLQASASDSTGMDQVSVTIQVVDQNAVPIPGSRIQLQSGFYPNGTAIDLPIGTTSIILYPGILGQNQSSLYRTETITVSAQSTQMNLVWATSEVTVDIQDQSELPINGSRFIIPGYYNIPISTPATFALPVTDESTYPTMSGALATSGWPIEIYPGILGEPIGSLKRRASHEISSPSTNLSLEWKTSTVHVDIVDQNQASIPGSRFYFTGVYNIPILTPATITLPITDESEYPSMSGNISDGWTFGIDPGVLGGQQGSLKRTEVREILETTSNVSFEWITSDVTVDVVDQNNHSITGSRIYLPGVYNIPILTPATITLPITDELEYPAMSGSLATGWRIGLNPGLWGLQTGNLSRTDTQEVAEGTSDVTLMWQTAECHPSITNLQNPGTLTVITRFAWNNSEPQSANFSLPVTQDATQSDTFGSYGVNGYPLRFWPSDQTTFADANLSFDPSGLIGTPTFSLGGATYEVSCAAPPPPPIVHVNKSVSGGNGSGDSWANAVQHLQDALNLARLGGVDEIWVANGTYKPDEGSNVQSGDRMAAFEMVGDVGVYGGFAGTETNRNYRPAGASGTTLSGDLASNDAASGFGNNAENSVHVVKAASISSFKLDGFTIQGGNANLLDDDRSGANLFIQNVPDFEVLNITAKQGHASRYAGGVYIDASTGTLYNSIAENNFAITGAGITMDNGSDTVLRDLNVRNNTADRFGGGVTNRASNLLMYNSLIQSNYLNATGGSPGGVGFHNTNTSDAFLVNMVIQDNVGVGESRGGGVYNVASGGSLTIANSVIARNTARYGGGMFQIFSPVTLANVTMTRNTANSQGGAVYASGSGGIIAHNSILWSNTANTNPGVNGSPFTQQNSVVEGTTSGTNPLMQNAAAGQYNLLQGSAGLAAGDIALIPLDFFDQDHDGDTSEPLPYDLNGQARVQGCSVEIGAVEYLGDDCVQDADGDGVPDDQDADSGGIAGVPDTIEGVSGDITSLITSSGSWALSNILKQQRFQRLSSPNSWSDPSLLELDPTKLHAWYNDNMVVAGMLVSGGKADPSIAEEAEELALALLDFAEIVTMLSVEKAREACDGSKKCTHDLKQMEWNLNQADKFMRKARDNNSSQISGAISFLRRTNGYATNVTLSSTGKRAIEIDIPIEELIQVSQTSLKSNYPNPFNPQTTIPFDLKKSSQVRIEVFDMLGRRVTMLVDSSLPAGQHTVQFDAGQLPSGVYIYRMTAGSSAFTKMMRLIK